MDVASSPGSVPTKWFLTDCSGDHRRMYCCYLPGHTGFWFVRHPSPVLSVHVACAFPTLSVTPGILAGKLWYGVGWWWWAGLIARKWSWPRQ